MGNSLTRRSFVKWGSATAGAAALVGFTGCAPAGDAGTDTGPAASAGEKGEWKTGACMNNCSCGSSRCLLKVYVEDGVPLKVRTDEQDEDTIEVPQRRACPRGRAQISNITSPARIKHPMKRKGWSPENPNGEMRGKDEWERIGWDEALDLIAAELNKVKEAYGPESVIFSCGTGRDIAPYITRLCWSFGSPNFVNIFSGNACYLPRVAGCIATTGAIWVADCAQQFPDRYDNPAWQMPETMFVWGNYPLIANSDGFFGHWVVDLMKRGMKIVMIDPKVTWLSAKAEVHLPVRPGTDAALALAMMNVIINEALYDHDFVDRWCYGFEELSEHVQPFTPEYAETTTWVPAERIRKAARILAASRPATLQWGVAFDQTKWANGTAHAAVAVQGALLKLSPELFIKLYQGAKA